MKILQIHNYYKTRGGESYVVYSEKRLLEKNNHDVLLHTADNHDILNIISKRRNFYLELRRIVNTFKPDIVHIHNVFHIIGTDIYLEIKKYGIPIVQTLHNYRLLCINGLFYDDNQNICELCRMGQYKYSLSKKCYQHSYIKSFFMKQKIEEFRKCALKYIDKYIALTHFSYDKYTKSGFPYDKIVVKPNFIINDERISFRDNKYALFIGRISKEKGIKDLLNVFKDINFNLIVAGDGPQLKQLIMEYSHFSNISFVGYIMGKQKQEILKNCSFVVFPSLWYEMFPISILEAYSYSKAVVASNIGGLAEIVENGKTGFLFEVGNRNSFKSAINRILKNDKYIELGQSAKKIFNEEYTQERNYDMLIGIYNNVINGKNE